MNLYSDFCFIGPGDLFHVLRDDSSQGITKQIYEH